MTAHVRVALDYTPALRQRAGIGRFVRGLVRGLASQGTALEILLVATADTAPPGDAQPPFPIRRFPLGSRAMEILWHRLRLPLPADWWTGPLDLYHATDFLLPPLRCRGAVTVHDLSFLRHPEFHHPALVRYLRDRIRGSVHRASLVLTDSCFSRDEVLALLDAPSERIRVVYGGVEESFQPVPAPEQQTVLARHGLREPYLLFVGTLEPRKNLGAVLEAFGRLRRRGLRHTLAIAGGEGWLGEGQRLRHLAEPMGDAVRFLGFVPDNDLPALLSGADLFVYPSLYEGFGLPVLEAMACGCPVACSRAGSLPEVGGDAAFYFEAADANEIAIGLEQALEAPELLAERRRQGLVRAAAFTWEAAARQLLVAYEAALL
ncbi:MAG: glycosyltransferase family 4 protein [Chloroflexi bacterium]|nr:glycosyltransferase family 4 protein [Chloroflexota bacterium]